MKQNELPLRLGVGIIVLNKENKVFVGKRRDNPINKWQMPQGGVDRGENLVDAMKRELKEETSIRSIIQINSFNSGNFLDGRTLVFTKTICLS